MTCLLKICLYFKTFQLHQCSQQKLCQGTTWTVNDRWASGLGRLVFCGPNYLGFWPPHNGWKQCVGIKAAATRSGAVWKAHQADISPGMVAHPPALLHPQGCCTTSAALSGPWPSCKGLAGEWSLAIPGTLAWLRWECTYCTLGIPVDLSRRWKRNHLTALEHFSPKV